MSKKQKQEKEAIKWHRLGGMVLKPLFKLLGYNTEVEVDVLRLLYSKVLRLEVHNPSRFTGSRVISAGRTCSFRLTFPPRAF